MVDEGGRYKKITISHHVTDHMITIPHHVTGYLKWCAGKICGDHMLASLRFGQKNGCPEISPLEIFLGWSYHLMQIS